MKRALLGLIGCAVVGLGVPSASAWMHAGPAGVASGGGGSWSAHGWRGGSASGGGGSWSGTGFRGGTASGGGGSWSAHGAYGGSAYHYGGYGGSYYGAYHPPGVVNYYGAGCAACGGWGAGTAAAGLITGAALGAAAANANAAQNTSNAYAAGVAAGQASALGAIYSTLPAGCAETVAVGNTYYRCGAMWLQPAFGANGVYYRSVAAP
jgi:hypothetical protein